VDSYSDHPSEFDGPAAAAEPQADIASAIGTDERRMHVRAYNYWCSLLDGRDYPSIEDLEPGDIQDFGPHSVLLDFTEGSDNPATPYIGTAIRAISQDRAIMPLMGVNPNRVFVVTSALGGALAGLGACLLVLQYDIHPAIGLTFGPIVFLICVLGGLGNMLGGLVASFIFAQFISVGGFFLHIEWGYVIAFAFFIAVMFWRPQGILGAK